MNAVHFQAITALIIVVVLGYLLTDDPYPFGLNVYVFLGTMLGLIFAGIYILVNLACIGYLLARATRRVQLAQARRRAGLRRHRHDPGRCWRSSAA